MKRRWMSQVAGILDIITGILGLLMVLGLFTAVSFAHGTFGFIGFPLWIPLHAVSILGIIAVLGLILSLLALIGGVLAVQRKAWGLSLAGSMASLFIFAVFGLVSTILIALAKDEFESACQHTPPDMEKVF